MTARTIVIRSVPLLVLLCGCAAGQTEHGRDFWRAVVKSDYAVPGGASADVLAPELSSMLALPDPELRDDLAYSILAVWIYRGRFSTPVLLRLTDEWRNNLNDGIGESGTNSVLKRSFSALCLASMAKREVKTPFMGMERYHKLVADGITYLEGERDLRGYDSQLHWIHATAHTADLLSALAQSPLLTQEEGAQILHAVDARLTTAAQVYTQGEQDRLADAVVSVIRRSDFDPSSLQPWLTKLADEDRNIWTATTPEGLARFQNHNYLLQALTVRILLEPESVHMANYRREVVKVLAER